MPSSVSRDTRKKTLLVGDEVDEAMLSPASTVLDDYEEQSIEDAASDDDFQLGSQLGSSDSSDNSGHANVTVEKPSKGSTKRRARGPAAVSLRSPPHPLNSITVY
jgi:hypothetical protein